MRTVTFSDPEVAKIINEQFVSAWVNKRPDIKFQDGIRASGTGVCELSNGEGLGAVTCFFAAPDGAVFHAMPGSLNVAAFLKEVQFALGLHPRLYEKGARRDDANARYFEAHRNAIDESKGWIAKRVHSRLSESAFTVGTMDLRLFADFEIT